MLLLFWYCLKTCAPPTASRVSHWFLSVLLFLKSEVGGLDIKRGQTEVW